jgi:hypothetical protein
MDHQDVTPGAVGAPTRGPEAADALATARVALARTLDDAFAAVRPADAAPEPARTADAVVDRAEAGGVLAPEVAGPLREPLAERLRTAETAVEARRRAARALEWALLAQRRRAWDGGRPPDGA